MTRKKHYFVKGQKASETSVFQQYRILDSVARSSQYIFTNKRGTDYIAEILAIHFHYLLDSILGFAMVNQMIIF